jgi:hypothetical protein
MRLFDPRIFDTRIKMTVRMEEYTGLMEGKVVAVVGDTWLPTEFMLTQYITRILVVGRTSAASAALAADAGWTQVWRSPGAKEWSCLLGVIGHMPGPVLLVVGPDVVLSPKVVESFSTGFLTVVLRTQAWPAAAPKPSHVFFPTLVGIQDWIKVDPKVLTQLAAQKLGLVIADGVSHWFNPVDSAPMTTLTTAQVAQQLRALGTALERV